MALLGPDFCLDYWSQKVSDRNKNKQHIHSQYVYMPNLFELKLSLS